MIKRQLNNQIIAAFTGYVKDLTQGSYRSTQKMFKGVLFGMMVSKSVLISEITRAYSDGSGFRATHKRFCRGLSSVRWDTALVQTHYLHHTTPLIKNSSFIAVDIGDITKTRARRMPQMTTVRDGSTGTLKKGWWLLEVEAITKQGKHLPLWLELFSTTTRQFKSFRYLTQKTIQSLAKELGTKGLWLFDRGFDNWQFFQFLHDLKLRFLMRANSKRNVFLPGHKHCHSLSSVVKNITYTETILWGHKRNPYPLSLGSTEIIIPQSGQKLLLVVARGFGRHPLLLFTNDLSSTRKLSWFVRSYLKRWGVEVSGRFIKQAFQLELIRLLSFRGLVNLVWLTLWCFGFLSRLYFCARKIFIRLTSSVPGFTAVPAFCYYRLAHALSVVLSRCGPFAKSNFFAYSNFG